MCKLPRDPSWRLTIQSLKSFRSISFYLLLLSRLLPKNSNLNIKVLDRRKSSKLFDFIYWSYSSMQHQSRIDINNIFLEYTIKIKIHPLAESVEELALRWDWLSYHLASQHTCILMDWPMFPLFFMKKGTINYRILELT